MAIDNNVGGKRKPRKRRAAPRKNAAEKEVVVRKKRPVSEDMLAIKVTDEFIIRGDRKIPRSNVQSIDFGDTDEPMPTYRVTPEVLARRAARGPHQKASPPRSRNVERNVNVSTNMDPRVDKEAVKLATMAEQVGPALKEERQRVKRMERNKTAEAVLANNPGRGADPMLAMCPKDEREPQPSGFSPFSLLKKIYTDFVNHPMVQDMGSLSTRVFFEVLDAPTIRTGDAELVGLEPVFILGRQIGSSSTKRMCGYAQPSPDTYQEAEERFLTVLRLWAEGREAVQRSSVFDVVERSEEVIQSRSAVLQPLHYRQTMRIFRPHDDIGQVCIVVV